MVSPDAVASRPMKAVKSMTVTAGSFTAKSRWLVVSTYIAAWAKLHMRRSHLPTGREFCADRAIEFMRNVRNLTRQRL
jgi:hypothetical protein